LALFISKKYDNSNIHVVSFAQKINISFCSSNQQWSIGKFSKAWNNSAVQWKEVGTDARSNLVIKPLRPWIDQHNNVCNEGQCWVHRNFANTKTCAADGNISYQQSFQLMVEILRKWMDIILHAKLS